MTTHVHIGLFHILVNFLSVILVGVWWRLIASHNKDNPVGQAMAFAY